jgi:hypothetical protein
VRGAASNGRPYRDQHRADLLLLPVGSARDKQAQRQSSGGFCPKMALAVWLRGDDRSSKLMHPIAMYIIFALMDADGDGTISLQEFQAAHERLFKAMDRNKDGQLSLDEMQSFMHGSTRAGQAR